MHVCRTRDPKTLIPLGRFQAAAHNPLIFLLLVLIRLPAVLNIWDFF